MTTKHSRACQTGRAEVDAAVADLAEAVHILQRMVSRAKEKLEPPSAKPVESALGRDENELCLVPKSPELPDATFDLTMVTTVPTEPTVVEPDLLTSEEAQRFAMEDAFAKRIFRVCRRGT